MTHDEDEITAVPLGKKMAANPANSSIFFGLMSCLAAGLPFLKGSIYATLFFNAVFFGGYFIIEKFDTKKQILAKA